MGARPRSVGRRVLIQSAVIVAAIALGWAASGPIRSGGASAAHVFRRFFLSPSIIGNYLDTHPARKLQIGAGGNNMAGWLNTDIEPGTGQAYLDATRRFPLPDASFRYAFSEQVIEHMSYEDGLSMLRECQRILQPGGKIRIATPNLLKFVELFQEAKTEDMRRYMAAKVKWHGWPWVTTPECLILNLQMQSFGHKFLYDPQTLRHSLETVGYQQIREFAPGDSDDILLKGVEVRHTWQGRFQADYETMVFQAVRP